MNRKVSGWTANDMVEQSGRVAVITGANSGVGYESAIALARKGAQVVMACRSMEKAESARQTILESVPTATVDILPLDLGSLQSIYGFANTFLEKYEHLDILMNNAGIMAPLYGTTADGFETQFGTNHLGHFALTGLLLPLVMKTPQSRIVTVSSGAYRTGVINFDDLQSKKRYVRWNAYAQSKLANILFARELQHKLEAAGSETISNVTHPGHAVTNLQSHGTNPFERFAMRVANSITGQPAAEGANAQLYAATASEARGGEFYGPRQGLWGEVARVELNERGKNDADAARLWQISEQLTGICYDFEEQPVLEYA